MKAHPSIRATRLAPLAVSFLALLLVGCGGEEEKASVFDEISRMPTREEMVEIDLGNFVVPVPMILESATERFEPANLMEIEMRLVAIADPDEADQVERLKKRNEGRIRDRVIRVCRTTTRDDLTESQKVTLKAHLLDAIQPLLGGQSLRQVVVLPARVDEL